MSKMRSTVLAGVLIGLVTAWAGAQGAAFIVGPGDARPLDLISDGKVFLRLTPAGAVQGMNNATLGGSFGASVDTTFAAGNYMTNGDKTWTVESSDVIVSATASMGKLRLFQLDVQTSDIGAGTTGNVVTVALPFTVKKRAVVPAVIINNSVSSSDARCLAGAGTATLSCTLNSGVVFASGTGVFGLRVQFWAEVS